MIHILSALSIVLWSTVLAASDQKEERKEPASVRQQTLADVLPQDVLKLIFRQVGPYTLAYAGKVCKSWRAASKDDALWRAYLEDVNFDLSEISEEVTKNQKSWLVQHLPKFFKPDQGYKPYLLSLISLTALELFFQEYCASYQQIDKSLSGHLRPPQWDLKGDKRKAFEHCIAALDKAGFIVAQVMTDLGSHKRKIANGASKFQYDQLYALFN